MDDFWKPEPSPPSSGRIRSLLALCDARAEARARGWKAKPQESAFHTVVHPPGLVSLDELNEARLAEEADDDDIFGK